MNAIPRLLAVCLAALSIGSASAASLTEASIRTLLASMDSAIEARSVQGVAALLSPTVKVTAEMTIRGRKQVQTMSRDEYLTLLNQAWTSLDDYQYKRTNQKITIAPDAASATVSAMVHETMSMQGQSMTTLTSETATIRLIDGRPLITAVLAQAQ